MVSLLKSRLRRKQEENESIMKWNGIVDEWGNCRSAAIIAVKWNKRNLVVKSNWMFSCVVWLGSGRMASRSATINSKNWLLMAFGGYWLAPATKQTNHTQLISFFSFQLMNKNNLTLFFSFQLNKLNGWVKERDDGRAGVKTHNQSTR